MGQVTVPFSRRHAGRNSPWTFAAWLLTAIMLFYTGARTANAAPAQKVVSFRSATVPSPTAVTVTDNADRTVLRAFLRENPDIRVERFAVPTIQGAGMDSGPLLAIAAGMPPHAIYVNFRQSSTYINHGFLTPIEILLARLHSDNPRERQVDANGKWLADPTPVEIAAALKAIRSRVVEPAWPVMYRASSNPRVRRGKHVWSMPIATVVKALVYRKDLFHQAGIDPNDPPETWAELADYAKRLTIPSRGQYGLQVSGGTVVSYGIYNLLVSNGARAMKQDESGKWHAAFDSKAAAEAILFFIQMAHDGTVQVGQPGPTGSLDWENGKIGMKFAYLDDELLSRLNPQLVGVAPVPIAWNGKRGNEINCRMLGVFAGSTPQQKLAVMKYIWFITSKRAQRIRTQVYVKNGYGRFVNPVLLKEFGYDHILKLVPKTWRATFEIAVKHGIPEPYGRNTQFIYRYMSVPINWALNANDPPLEKLPKAAALKQIEQHLKAAVSRVNLQVLGEVPPAEMTKRRVVGGLALAALLLGFGAALWWVWRSFSAASAAAQEKIPLKRYLWGYALLAPALGLLLVWSYIPLAGGTVLSLFDYQLVISSAFAGVDNFANALYDPQFWSSLFHTFFFVALVIGLGFWPPILLAILLDEVPTETLKYFFRTVYYLPQIVSGVIMIFLWRQLYEASASGYLNQIVMSLNLLGPIAATLLKWVMLGVWLLLIFALITLPIKLKEMNWFLRLALWAAAVGLIAITIQPLIHAYMGPSAEQMKLLASQGVDTATRQGWPSVLNLLGTLWGSFDIQPLKWIQSHDMAMLCVVIPMVWATSGPGCILYLAALKTVPGDLYEAAAIDGAGVWQRVFYITLPKLKFLIVIQFIAAVIAAFKGGTDFILALTGGGPNGATRILSLDIFERTFMGLEFGQGAAMAWLLGGLLIALTAYQMRMLARAEFRSSGHSETPPTG